jgi:flagellar biogenesis protein FliO
MEWVFVKMMLSLAAVLGLMLAVAMLLKRFVLPGRIASGNRVPIDILGQKTLQPKRSVVILKVLDHVLVVGMSEQGMHLLTELTGDEVHAASKSAEFSEGKPLGNVKHRAMWWEKSSFASFLRANEQLLEKK